MEEIKLGDMVTINGVSLQGQVISVNQNLHSVPRYCVRRLNAVSGEMVEFWYYAPELTLRPAEAEATDGEPTDQTAG